MLNIVSNIWSGHFALYDLCDHNLWAPAVIPKPETRYKTIAVKQEQTVKKIINQSYYRIFIYVIFDRSHDATISEFLIPVFIHVNTWNEKRFQNFFPIEMRIILYTAMKFYLIR